MNGGIAIIGASGYIGSKLFELMGNEHPRIVGTYHKNAHFRQDCSFNKKLLSVNLKNRCSFFKFLDDNLPNTVVASVGSASPDFAERNKDFFKSDSLSIAENLSAASLRYPNIKFVMLSSIYVFGGSPANECYEDTPTAPCNFYGSIRRAQEDILLSGGKNNLIIRLPWMIGNPRHKSDPICRTIESLLRGNKNIVLDPSGVRYPTFIECLGRYILSIHPESGIRHFSSNEGVSRYTLFKLILERYFPKSASAALALAATTTTPSVAFRPQNLKLSSKFLNLVPTKSLIENLDFEYGHFFRRIRE